MRKEFVTCLLFTIMLRASLATEKTEIVDCLNKWVDFNIKGFPIKNIWELSAQEKEIAPTTAGFSELKSACIRAKELATAKGGECQKQFNQITGSISIAPITMMGTFKWVKPEDIYQPIKKAISRLEC